MSSYYIEDCFDEADVYNMDQHKFIHAGHSGKGRSKREVQQRTNAYDPNGHTRKTMQKLVNNKQKQQQQQRWGLPPGQCFILLLLLLLFSFNISFAWSWVLDKRERNNLESYILKLTYQYIYTVLIYKKVNVIKMLKSLNMQYF